MLYVVMVSLAGVGLVPLQPTPRLFRPVLIGLYLLLQVLIRQMARTIVSMVTPSAVWYTSWEF